MGWRFPRLARLIDRRWLLVSLAPLAAGYVYLAFTLPQPDLRIALRTAPVLPFAIWATFYDARRPLQTAPPALRRPGRIALLILTIAFAMLVLGLGLNWIYDPSRVV